MHAGKLHYKEHLVISALENKYSTLFAKNNPSSKHSVPTMTTQSSTREISFPPAQGKERAHAEHSLAVPVCAVTTDQAFAFPYIQLFGSGHHLPPHGFLSAPWAKPRLHRTLFLALYFPSFSPWYAELQQPAVPARWRKQTCKIISFTEPNIPGQTDTQPATTSSSLPRTAQN